MKTHSRKFAAILAIGLVTCGLLCQQAQAAGPITGNIDFGGVVTYNTTSLATATEVDIWNTSFVLQDSGSFSSVAPGTNATMAAPWVFNSGTPGTPAPGPSTPALWMVGGFKLDLTSSTVISQSSNFLNVKGVGTLSGNGFDPTPGTWSFTSSNSNGTDNATFGFQAQSAAVPEGSTVALFAIGLVGLLGRELLRRKAA